MTDDRQARRLTHCATGWSPAVTGAATIGGELARMVRADGYVWTVDQVLTDGDRCAAALEWTVFRGPQGGVTRGVDWVVFEPRTWHIREVRPYHASPLPVDAARHELLGFDYAGRGYPTTLAAHRAASDP